MPELAPAPKFAERAAPYVREYRDPDREAVREICRQTAFRNTGYRAMLDDAELFADYWSRYYTDYEPESILIVEHGGAVVGYVLGCRDTRRYHRVMARTIVPRVAGLLLARAATGRYRAMPRRRALYRWLAFDAWREAPPVDVARYPAHYHINLGHAARGHALYSTLGIRFADMLLAHGCERLHTQITERLDGGWHRLISAYALERPGLIEHYAERRTVVARRVLGIDEDYVNRVYGIRTDTMKGYLQWLARTHRI